MSSRLGKRGGWESWQGMEMEGSARFAEDPRAKGTWGRLLEREGQNPI